MKFYLNQSSSFLSTHHAEVHNVPHDWQITSITEPAVPEYDPETHLLSEEWKDYSKKRIWNSFAQQKAKNEQIVRECKELLLS